MSIAAERKQALLTEYATAKGDTGSPEVQVAIQNWGTKDENKNSNGYTRLIEAAALAVFYEKYLNLGKPLPAELKAFTKYAAAK